MIVCSLPKVILHAPGRNEQFLLCSVTNHVLPQLDLLRSWKETTACKNDVNLLAMQLDEQVATWYFPAPVVLVFVCCLPNAAPSAPCRRALKVTTWMPIETVVSEIDIFVSSPGNFNIIPLDHMKKFRINEFAGNKRHFGNEIDFADSGS